MHSFVIKWSFLLNNRVQSGEAREFHDATACKEMILIQKLNLKKNSYILENHTL